MKKINNKSIVFALITLAILALGLALVPFKGAAAYGTNFIYQSPEGNLDQRPATPVNNPRPGIGAISPSSSNVGVGTKTITITGNGFIPSSVARLNASDRPTTFIDSSHLLVQITGNDTYAYRTNGGFYITVYNGGPGGGYSNAVFFTVNDTVPAPATGINRNTGNNFSDYNPAPAVNYGNTPDNFTDTTQVNYSDQAYRNLTSNAIYGSNTFLPSGLVQWVLFAIIIVLIVILVRRISGAREKYHEAPLKHA
jgi:hypothetical protein